MRRDNAESDHFMKTLLLNIIRGFAALINNILFDLLKKVKATFYYCTDNMTVLQYYSKYGRSQESALSDVTTL